MDSSSNQEEINGLITHLRMMRASHQSSQLSHIIDVNYFETLASICQPPQHATNAIHQSNALARNNQRINSLLPILPEEVWGEIFIKVDKASLKSLCLANRLFESVAASILWSAPIFSWSVVPSELVRLRNKKYIRTLSTQNLLDWRDQKVSKCNICFFTNIT